MSIPARFASRKEALNAGWFSRRHDTSAAHYSEQERYRAERDEKREREERQRQEADERKAAWKARKAVA